MIKGALNIFRCTACVFTVMLAACSSTKELRPGPKELIILLAGEDGKTGAVAVGEGGSAVILDSPLATAEVDVQGHITKGVATEEEIKRIFAPALAAQPPKPEKFILYFLYFDTGKVEVTADFRAELERLFAEVARRKAVEVQVIGHTDTVGTTEYNDRLSHERATAVRDMLIQRGLHTNFIRVIGRGERDLLVPTDDDTPHPKNRRVEIIVR